MDFFDDEIDLAALDAIEASFQTSGQPESLQSGIGRQVPATFAQPASKGACTFGGTASSIHPRGDLPRPANSQPTPAVSKAVQPGILQQHLQEAVGGALEDEGFDWAAFDLQCLAAAEPDGNQKAPSGNLMEASGAASDSEEPLMMGCKTLNPGMQVHRRNAAKWVYPKEVPERKYQVEIIQAALLHNTLVCLPTGLGKTLIAAVVMHNFARWFPQGKIIFVAPTRPLVNQQVEACRRFMGMHESSLHEMTGQTDSDRRAEVWGLKHKNVFFCTPQVFKNDVCRGICPAHLITCVVVDECHRATGKSDIVLAIRKMAAENLKFRVVGLSATPGRDRKAVQEVISNLLVSRIEVREETHSDVVQHVHPRHVQVVTVPLSSGELAEVRHDLLHMLRELIGRLVGLKAYYGEVNAEYVSGFTFLQAKERYAGRFDHNIHTMFRQCHILADVRKMLDDFGADSAHKLLLSKEQDPAMKPLQGSHAFLLFKKRLERLSRDAASHPKMRALQTAVLQHFGLQHLIPASADHSAAERVSETARMRAGRVIIFTSFRESVHEIIGVLRKHEPHIKPRTFIGQGKGARGGAGGISQKEQQKVLSDFTDGLFNVLVATCIGEEGLDICQVEKVICYDAFQSPIRNIQRMGRTGRHDAGHVVHLISEGAEEQKYHSNLENVERLYSMLRSQAFDMHSPNPRMLPRQFSPARLNVECETESFAAAGAAVGEAPPKKQRKPPASRAKQRPHSASGRPGRQDGKSGKDSSSGRGYHAEAQGRSLRAALPAPRPATGQGPPKRPLSGFQLEGQPPSKRASPARDLENLVLPSAGNPNRVADLPLIDSTTGAAAHHTGSDPSRVLDREDHGSFLDGAEWQPVPAACSRELEVGVPEAIPDTPEPPRGECPTIKELRSPMSPRGGSLDPPAPPWSPLQHCPVKIGQLPRPQGPGQAAVARGSHEQEEAWKLRQQSEQPSALLSSAKPAELQSPGMTGDRPTPAAQAFAQPGSVAGKSEGRGTLRRRRKQQRQKGPKRYSKEEILDSLVLSQVPLRSWPRVASEPREGGNPPLELRNGVGMLRGKGEQLRPEKETQSSLAQRAECDAAPWRSLQEGSDLAAMSGGSPSRTSRERETGGRPPGAGSEPEAVARPSASQVPIVMEEHGRRALAGETPPAVLRHVSEVEPAGVSENPTRVQPPLQRGQQGGSPKPVDSAGGSPSRHAEIEIDLRGLSQVELPMGAGDWENPGEGLKGDLPLPPPSVVRPRHHWRMSFTEELPDALPNGREAPSRNAAAEEAGPPGATISPGGRKSAGSNNLSGPEGLAAQQPATEPLKQRNMAAAPVVGFRRPHRAPAVKREVKHWGFASKLRGRQNQQQQQQNCLAQPNSEGDDGVCRGSGSAPAEQPLPSAGRLSSLRDKLVTSLTGRHHEEKRDRRSEAAEAGVVETPFAPIRHKRRAQVVESTPRQSGPQGSLDRAGTGGPRSAGRWSSSGALGVKTCDGSGDARGEGGRKLKRLRHSFTEDSDKSATRCHVQLPCRHRVKEHGQVLEFLDVEARLSGEEESYESEEGLDELETDFLSLTQAPGPERSEMLMYHRSVVAAGDETPQFLRRARQKPPSINTPLQSQRQSSEFGGSDGEDDSFIDRSEGESDHLLRSTVKGGQSQHSELCELCQKSGRLVLCAGCPSAFHYECLGHGHDEASLGSRWFCAVCRDS